MLYTMKDLLSVAKENKFAVPAFNICSYDMLKAVLEAVEEENAPVIIEIHPDEIDYLGDEFVETVKAHAHNASVPVVIHLDHGGGKYDVMRAIRNGYTSVMIDASTKPFEDNKRITKEIVEIAHQVNVSVEAELGTIGANDGAAEGGTANIIYTDPQQAVEFVKETGIDTLAIAIGTAHGKYPKDMVPKLNIELLKELNAALDIPFVLHGGSGNKDEEVSESVKHGVCKVNISTDIKTVFFDEVKNLLVNDSSVYEPSQVYPAANEKVKEVVKHKLSVLNTIGQANKY